jgi:hypothetical protein
VLDPYTPPPFDIQAGGGVKGNWTSRLSFRGLCLGGSIPMVIGFILILSATNFRLADRESASCGTTAAGGILVILFGTPIVGLVFAAIGGVCGFVIDSSWKHKEQSN